MTTNEGKIIFYSVALFSAIVIRYCIKLFIDGQRVINEVTRARSD